MNKYKLLFLLLGIVIITAISCKRDATTLASYSGISGLTQVKIIDAAPNFRTMYNGQDSFNVVINGKLVASPFITFGSVFPSTSSSYGYVAIPAGAGLQVKLSVPGVLTGDSVQIVSFPQTFMPDSLYSLFVTDSGMVNISDSHVQPLSGYFNLRFANFVLNDTAGKTVDIWSTRYNNFIFTKIKPNSYTAFTQLEYSAALNDTLIVKRTGTNFPLDTLAAVAFSNQRTYTLYYKGDGNLGSSPWVSTTKAPKRRHLAVYVNQ